MALTCAAINDAIAWCLLAFVVSVMQSTPAAAVRTVAWTIVYIAVMLTVGRALVTRIVTRLDTAPHLGERSLALVLVAVLLSAVATEFIGIHAIFGAFLLGAIMPHDSKVARSRDDTHRRPGAGDVPAGVLRVHRPAHRDRPRRDAVGLDVVRGDHCRRHASASWAAPPRPPGCSASTGATSGALGILMNTRGLVELIVLNIGLDLGVITPRLFTMLVIMAIVTTMMTSPILMAILRSGEASRADGTLRSNAS